tara:strand:- start:2476 stop:2760 length:285 start_codon:yes stop_codon:yes gene_type:complete
MDDTLVTNGLYEDARKRLVELHERYGFMRVDGWAHDDIPAFAYQERRRLSKLVTRRAWDVWEAIPKRERFELLKLVDKAKQNAAKMCAGVCGAS